MTTFAIGRKARASLSVCRELGCRNMMNCKASARISKVWVVLLLMPFSRHLAVGPALNDRGKQGTKRNLLGDHRGIPFTFAIERANRHGSKLVVPTLNAMTYNQPESMMEHPQNLLCMMLPITLIRPMGSYISVAMNRMLVSMRTNHQWYQEALKHLVKQDVSANLLEEIKKPRRWVVERLCSWLIRWEKLSTPYEAFLRLACALTCFHQSDPSLFG